MPLYFPGPSRESAPCVESRCCLVNEPAVKMPFLCGTEFSGSRRGRVSNLSGGLHAHRGMAMWQHLTPDRQAAERVAVGRTLLRTVLWDRGEEPAAPPARSAHFSPT